MPILYGEGMKAFIRLQEEIMKTAFDHTLFVWNIPNDYPNGLLASSPERFRFCGNLTCIDYDEYAVLFANRDPQPEYALTNFGTRIQLPIVRSSYFPCYVAYLACRNKSLSSPIEIVLKGKPGAAIDTFERVAHPSIVFDAISQIKSSSKARATVIYIKLAQNRVPQRFRRLPLSTLTFHVGNDFDFAPDTLLVEAETRYLYGASIKSTEDFVFSVSFPHRQAKPYVVLSLGSVRIPMYDRVGNELAQEPTSFVYVALAHFGNRIWADMIHSEDPLEEIYNNFRESSSTLTENHSLSCASFYRWTFYVHGFHPEVMVSIENVLEFVNTFDEPSTEKYHATISFNWFIAVVWNCH
ncbi:hypothetical protein GLAREA_01090 [Glarea lozoyensis ATCC 20868]|uniref:DUF8212 domain-containing protein n=1 Tax=Glarea lozoyensis (strain ATCC 20868 / MF5171) TaxID=1116229 RepID=S3CWB9_GLAL2|nr:uncharacterized protein GLAREA_01090 [Glarea lozoyensis ATCC 20868]EPE29930.1 hypothetical protein GLAREA_01090 [Glarea lozoyensis ATCC 20868]